MSTLRPFAYNPSQTPISGTIQIGDLAIGYPTIGFSNTGLQWWNGPNEDLGYVIAKTASNQPTSLFSGDLTLSTTYKAVDISLSNSNQTATQVFSYVQSVLGDTLINNNDKVMFSVLFNTTNEGVGVGQHVIGVGNRSMNYSGDFDGYPGNDTNSIGFSDDGNYLHHGGVYQTGFPNWGHDGDIIDIAIDMQLALIWIRVNGDWWNGINPAMEGAENPSTGISSVGNNEIQNLKSFYPVLCPGIYGSMTIQNNATYGLPAGFQLLGANVNASVGFLRSSDLTEISFVNLVNSKFSQNFTNGLSASSWLNSNGYWTSYSDIATSVLSLDAVNYTSGDWIDSIGGKSFVLYNSPTWSSSNGGYFNFDTSLSQSVRCSTSLPSLGTWSVAVWHYYDGTNTGGAPCIVTETFIGGEINYSLGNNNGGFSSGFFNGGWQVTDGYSLTPGNWYYIVGTYDGTTVKLYVNNVLVDSTLYTGTSTSSGSGIRLMERWDLSDYWGGRLAKVDIYDKALINSEIESIWNLTKSRFGL